MSSSYVTKKLLEVNEKLEDLTEEESKELLKEYESEEELNIHSPEFLKQT